MNNNTKPPLFGNAATLQRVGVIVFRKRRASAGVSPDLQQLFSPLYLFRCGRNGIGQGIGNAEFLPFEQS